jgi:hypothetical protein
MKFALTIELGNATMQTGEDIAGALKTAAEIVEGCTVYTEQDNGSFSLLPFEHKIIDSDGSIVGKWALA